MPRGLPDYFNPDTIVSQRLANVEEVVTHLRLIASLDNRGRTLFFDPFHETLASWQTGKSFDGVVAVLSTDQAYIPPSSVFIDAGTSGGNGLSYMLRYFYLGASTNLGLETSFLYNENSPNFRLDITYNLVGQEYFAVLEVLPLTGVIRIWFDGDWLTIGNVGFVAPSGGPWLPLKLVADFANALYIRALIGQLQIDLSAYSLGASAVAKPGQAEYRLQCAAVNAVTNHAYVGHAVGTVDEP